MVVFERIIIYLVCVSLAESSLPLAQPCLVCGGATIRIWSLMSGRGDRYLRITRNVDARSRHSKVDFAGHGDDVTSLIRIREKSTFRETRVQFVLQRNNQQYHLYAPSSNGELLAMHASQGILQTDGRNTFAPERLQYEHRLFTVFQSVKFRGYYLSCDGSGRTRLQQVINRAYRNPGDLFLIIDPGNLVRGVSFGSANGLQRDTWALRSADDSRNDYPDKAASARRTKSSGTRARKNPKPKPSRVAPTTTRRATRRCVSPKPRTAPRPSVASTRVATPAPKPSAVTLSLRLPDSITFVLCFWVKTTAKSAELMSLVEHVSEAHRDFWPKRRYQSPHSRRIVDYNVFNITITNGYLRFEIGHRRVVRSATSCVVDDGLFHHVCLSLDDRYIMDVYKDGSRVLRHNMQQVSCDLARKPSNDQRRGTFTLGKPNPARGEIFTGSLFQVNLWDQFPSFRITRIATNCACGGGSLVDWAELLNGTMQSVSFDQEAECPKLEGYDYDELTQNHLI